MARKRDKSQTQKQVTKERKVSYLQWEKWKRQAASPEYSREAIQVIDLLGKVSREQYLEALCNMEARFPGLGWKEAADNLHKFYFERNLNLKERKEQDSVSGFYWGK